MPEEKGGALKVLDEATDLNDDDEPDFVFSVRDRTVLFALNGNNGELIWLQQVKLNQEAFRLAPERRTIGKPLLINDVDDDGVSDIIAVFMATSKDESIRWIQTSSGKTGETINEYVISQDSFEFRKDQIIPNLVRFEGEKNINWDYWHMTQCAIGYGADDAPDGAAWQWYRTGEPFKRLRYQLGAPVGLQQGWRRNGKLFSNFEIRNGRAFGLRNANLCMELDDENYVDTAVAARERKALGANPVPEPAAVD